MAIVHHTKSSGDLGVAKAHADLVEQGYMVLFPTTEHAPFDLVTYDNGEFMRIQVKYRTAKVGAVTVEFSSVWADRHGTHRVPIDKAAIDVMCIYCPDTNECYYLRPGDHGPSVSLRVAPSVNNQARRVLWASDFRRLRDVATAHASRSDDNPNGLLEVAASPPDRWRNSTDAVPDLTVPWWP